MNTQPLIIVQRELDILKGYLQDAVLTDFNKKALSTELANAKIVGEDDLPDDAISLNTVVHVRERQSKRSFILQIVSPAAADVTKNKVSVLAPIAIALLGYRKRSTTKWEMPGGVQEFEILKVNRVAQEQAING